MPKVQLGRYAFGYLSAMRNLLPIRNDLFSAITYAQRKYAYFVHAGGTLYATEATEIGGFSAMR